MGKSLIITWRALLGQIFQNLLCPFEVPEFTQRFALPEQRLEVVLVLLYRLYISVALVLFRVRINTGRVRLALLAVSSARCQLLSLM